MKEWLLPICLQVIGVFVILAEIFIPSLGVLSIIALSLFGFSIYLVFTGISTTAGLAVTGLDILLVPFVIAIGIKVLANSPLSLKRELSKKDGIISQNAELEKFLGMKGTAVTDLRPAGIAQIESRRLDVVTDGEYIDKGSQIEVAKVTGNQIVVVRA